MNLITPIRSESDEFNDVLECLHRFVGPGSWLHHWILGDIEDLKGYTYLTRSAVPLTAERPTDHNQNVINQNVVWFVAWLEDVGGVIVTPEQVGCWLPDLQIAYGLLQL